MKTSSHSPSSSTEPSHHSSTVDLKFNQEELIRLMLQCLNDLGYSQTVEKLQQESGYQLENQWVSILRSSILEGEWNQAEVAINHLHSGDTTDGSYHKLLFLIRRQKYIESLLRKQKKDALYILRSEIAVLECDPLDLHELTSWLMDSSPEKIEAIGSMENVNEKRRILYDNLQEYMHKSQILPSRRLQSLLEQAVKYQTSNCLYHNSVKYDVSLYVDHSCDRENFPRYSTHLFEAHTDEVWFVSFSNDGTRLASASKDHTCIVWSVKDWKNLFILTGHEDAVSFLSWSPNDQFLLSCSNDHKVKLWNTQNGLCQRTFNRHTDAVTSCAWLPENDKFVSSSLDKTIYYWNIDGTLLFRWMGARVTDLAINHTGTKMITVCHERKIRIYDLETKTEQFIQEDHSITSLSLSADSKYALVNVSAEEIHLWDLEKKTLVNKYQGQKQGRFVIRSCFGGANQNFIVSGSEDCNVYIWNRDQAKLLEALPGHSGTVNSVSWNPRNPNMFASASDDCTIRIWGRNDQ